jgi:hypothetical protein
MPMTMDVQARAAGAQIIPIAGMTPTQGRGGGQPPTNAIRDGSGDVLTGIVIAAILALAVAVLSLFRRR